MVHIYKTAPDEVLSPEYRLFADGYEAPVYLARASAMPFNRRWPGHQRELEQTELTSFCSFSMSEPAKIRIVAAADFGSVTVRPLSKNIVPEINGREISFTVFENGAYSVELDSCRRALTVFADKPQDFAAKASGSEVIYFGCGSHDVGDIELKSNQTLFIDEGAVVYACVTAKDAENIKILGSGILDNSRNKAQILYEVSAPHPKGFAVPNAVRRHAVQLEYCKNIEISGIIIRDSCVYNIRPICCEKLLIDSVKILGCWRYNSDGIDMHNCSDVLITGCYLRTYDDSICIKGFDYSQDEQDMVHGGRTYDVFDNVIVEKCIIWNDWGRALEIGAETRAHEIKNIVFRDCDIIRGTHVMLDIQNVDYADVHDISFENIRIEYDERTPPSAMQNADGEEYRDDGKDHPARLFGCFICYIEEYCKDDGIRGKCRSITFKDISVTAPHMPPSKFFGYSDEYSCENIRIENLRLNGKKVESAQDANVAIGKFVRNVTVD